VARRLRAVARALPRAADALGVSRPYCSQVPPSARARRGRRSPPRLPRGGCAARANVPRATAHRPAFDSAAARRIQPRELAQSTGSSRRRRSTAPASSRTASS
jgi:hypothetical protein